MHLFQYGEKKFNYFILYFTSGQLVGVVGVDLSLHELLADITYFRSAGAAAYAFLIDLTGRVIMHPFLPNPIAVTHDLVVTDIEAFERTKEVQAFLKNTLRLISRSRRAAEEKLEEGVVYQEVFNTTKARATVSIIFQKYLSLLEYFFG